MPGPFGGNPFEGLPIFQDLAKLFTAAGPVNVEIARQLAVQLATEGRPEANVDPLERMRFEELGRVAEMHVAAATGLDTSAAGVLTVTPVGRADWAARTLEAYRPLLEALASSMASAIPVEEREAPDDATGLLGNIGAFLGPVLMGFQAGSMVGHLATRAFGQYDLPIPRPAADEILVVPANVDSWGADWSLPVDDLRMWVCLQEIAHHAVLRQPHVRDRVESLLRAYAGGFKPDPSGFESMLGDFDPTDMASLPEALTADPEALLGAMQTDEQRRVLTQLEALVAAIEGYVDHVMDTAGRRVVGAHPQLAEALRRRRVERGQGERFVERLFGVELSQAAFDRGATFVRGVLERAGDEGLSRLWRSARELPTPAEVDAPGLWLERIDLPDHS